MGGPSLAQRLPAAQVIGVNWVKDELRFVGMSYDWLMMDYIKYPENTTFVWGANGFFANKFWEISINTNTTKQGTHFQKALWCLFHLVVPCLEIAMPWLPMPWPVQEIVIWTFLCLAYIGAETDVCNLGDCRAREGRSTQQKKILRKLLRKNGAVLSSNVILSSTEGRTTCLARTAIQPGDLLFEIPLSISLWRGTVTLPNLPRNSRLSDMDRLVLYLALLMKDFHEDSKSTLVAYAGQLALEGSNATILWPQTALSWLVGTEAQEVTEHLLRRVSMIHAAAPLEVDHQDVKVAWSGICWFDARVDDFHPWWHDVTPKGSLVRKSFKKDLNYTRLCFDSGQWNMIQ